MQLKPTLPELPLVPPIPRAVGRPKLIPKATTAKLGVHETWNFRFPSASCLRFLVVLLNYAMSWWVVRR